MPFKALLLENEPAFSASVQSGLRAVVACGVQAARRAGVLSVPAGNPFA